MTRAIVWSSKSRADLIEIIRYIRRDDPVAARRIADRITRAIETLGQIPSGRPGRISGVYEKSVTRAPYVVAYRVVRLTTGVESVEIVRIIHQSRDWPDQSWPDD